MKFSMVLFLSGAALVAAGVPSNYRRQNDLPSCVEGEGVSAGSDVSFNSASECSDECYLREQADGDNKNGVCKGYCTSTPPANPIGGTWYYHCHGSED